MGSKAIALEPPENRIGFNRKHSDQRAGKDRRNVPHGLVPSCGPSALRLEREKGPALGRPLHLLVPLRGVFRHEGTAGDGLHALCSHSLPPCLESFRDKPAVISASVVMVVEMSWSIASVPTFG